MVDTKSKNLNRPHYAASLDPWSNLKYRDVEWLIKFGLLTCPQIVISDTQAIYSGGLHRLLKRTDAKKVLFTPDTNNNTPVIISLREGVTDIEQVLGELILNRETPAFFPWMTTEKQKKIDDIYLNKKSKNLGPFYDIAGDEFKTNIEMLNKSFKFENTEPLHWKGLEDKYPHLVKEAINKFIDSILHSKQELKAKNMILSVSELLLKKLSSNSEVNRSDLYRIIDQSPLSFGIKKTVEQKLLAEPYHLNFANNGGFNLLTGSEYNNMSFNKLFPYFGYELKALKPEEVIEIDHFPLFINEITFSRIQKIRSSESFRELLNIVFYAPSEKRIYALRDLLNLIYSEVSKEPKGIKKFGKLRLNLLLAPKRLQDQLYEAGINFSDCVSIISKIGGFLAGETVGNIVGIFGIGGIMGMGAALVVEQVTEKIISTSDRKSEFIQIVQQVTTTKVDI